MLKIKLNCKIIPKDFHIKYLISFITIQLVFLDNSSFLENSWFILES